MTRRGVHEFVSSAAALLAAVSTFSDPSICGDCMFVTCEFMLANRHSALNDREWQLVMYKD